MKHDIRMLFTFLIILFIYPLNAQIIGIDWGLEKKGDRIVGKVKSLGWYDGNYYTIQRRVNNLAKNVYFLEKINDNYNLVFSKKLDNKDYGVAFSKILNDKLYLFQIRNKGMSFKNLEVFYNVYNLHGEFIEEKVIAELNDFKKFNQVIDSYFFEASDSEEYIAFGILDKNSRDKYIRIVNGKININDLNKVDIESKKIELDDKPYSSHIYNLTVSDKGDIVNTIGYRFDKDDPFLYQFLTLDRENNYKNPIYLKAENVYFDKIELTKIGDNFMFSGLILTKGEKRNLYNGFFLAKLDLGKNEVQDLSTFIYSEEFFKSLGYKIKKDGRVKFKGSYDLEIITNQDGSGYLIADHVIRQENYYAGKESIVFPFDKEGQLNGDKVVLPKDQSGTEGLGYFAFSRNNQLYILYNGVIKNLEINSLDDLKSMKKVDDNGSATLVATIENGEKLKREMLFSYKEQDGYLVYDKCFYDEKGILINIMDKKKLRYGKLNFE